MARAKLRGEVGKVKALAVRSPRQVRRFRIFKSLTPSLVSMPRVVGALMTTSMVMDPAITDAVQTLESDRATCGWLRLQMVCAAFDEDHCYLCYGLPQLGRAALTIPFMPVGAGPTVVLEGRNFRDGELRQVSEKYLGIHGALVMAVKTEDFGALSAEYGDILSSTLKGLGDDAIERRESSNGGSLFVPDEAVQRRATAIAAEWVVSNRKELERLGSPGRGVPFFGDREFDARDDFVFVLMPFTPEHESVYEGVIKPMAVSMALVCRKADDAASRVIMEDVWRQINEARVIIADLTGSNPNVLYELGIAHTLGKRVILISQTGGKQDALPFDIRHVRTFEYENSIAGGKRLSMDLKSALESALAE